MKKIILSLLALFVFSTTSVLAATTSTSSVTITPTPNEVTQESIQKSLQDRIKKAIENNVEAVKDNIQNAFADKPLALIGKIESISENAFTLTLKGKTNGSSHKQVLITKDTAIVRAGKPIKLTELSLEEGIIAMGKIESDQSMTASRIVAYPIVVSKYERKVYNTTITDIDTSAKTVSFEQTGNQEFKLASRPVITNPKHDSLKLSSLKIGDKVITILYTHVEKEVTTVSHILVLPNDMTTDLNTNISTTSAQKAICGDDLCQSTETPETCPQDCTKR